MFGPAPHPQAEVKAHIGNKLLFPITTDVEEGDLVEYDLPSGKTRTVRLNKVTHHRAPRGMGSGNLDHISAEFSLATQPRPVFQPKLDLPGLHPRISDTSGPLFRDAHFRQAVREAFQAVEHRVQKLSGRQETGTPLMGAVFSGETPALVLQRHLCVSLPGSAEGW